MARLRLVRAVPREAFRRLRRGGWRRALFAESVGGRHRLVVLASHRLVSLPLASHLDQDALSRVRGIRQRRFRPVHPDDAGRVSGRCFGHRRGQVAHQVAGSPADHVVVRRLDLDGHSVARVRQLKGDVQRLAGLECGQSLLGGGIDVSPAVQEETARKGTILALDKLREYLVGVRYAVAAARGQISIGSASGPRSMERR